jgi:hypothetical protein
MRFVIALLVLCVSIPALAADVNGKWKASFQGQDGQNMEIIFDLKVDGEKLTGTAEGPMGNNTITEGKLVGDAISFTVDAGDMKILHKGTVSGDEMKLKVELPDNTVDMTATRVAPPAAH